MQPTRRTRPPSILVTLVILNAGLVLALSAVHAVQPQSSGLLALSQIFAPYLFVPLLAAVPFVLWQRHVVASGAVLACVLVFGIRFGSSLVSLPPNSQPTHVQITALTWNLELNNRQFDTIINTLAASSADVIALQELSFAQARAIASSDDIKQLYPYQLLAPTRGVRGMGLLSRYPVIESDVSFAPSLQSARLDLGDRILNVVNGHPSRSRFHLPDLYDAAGRNLQMRQIRARIDTLLDQGEPLLVLGDYNVTEREPMYHTLTAGLNDAHLLVGQGPGHTWRHSRIEWLPVGLLRIDYILSSVHLLPTAASVDCTPRGSDHCPVRVSYVLQ